MIQFMHRNKNFQKFLTSVIISNIGDYIDDIAFVQVVYLLTKSTLLSSYIFAIKIVCSFLSVFTATWVDRENKKELLSISCLAQSGTLMLFIILYHFGCLNVFLLLALTTLQAFFSTFVKPVQNAVLPFIVKKEDIIQARSILTISDQFVQVSSYALSGIIIEMCGIQGALFIDMVTFLIMPILFKSITLEKAIKNQKESYIESLKNGFCFLKNSGVIVLILILTFVANFFIAPVDSLMPAYIKQSNIQTNFYSGFMVCIALGQIIGSLLISKKRKQKMQISNSFFNFGYLLGAFGMIMLFWMKWYSVLIAACLIGISTSIVSILNASLIQMTVPKEMTARIFSIFKCVSFVASPFGILMAGYCGEKIEMRYVFIIFGIGMFLFSVLGFFYIRGKERVFQEEKEKFIW